MDNKRFKILRHRGDGAYGEVWEAQDTTLRRTVAIKFVEAGGPIEAGSLSQARALAKTPCENIVQVYDHRVLEHPASGVPSPAIVMELVGGPSLSAVLRGPVLTQVAAKNISTDVLVALQAIHDAGTAHGDLWEGNVLLNNSNQAKVIDPMWSGTHLGTSTASVASLQADDLRRSRDLIAKVLDHSKAPFGLGDRFMRLTSAAKNSSDLHGALHRIFLPRRPPQPVLEGLPPPPPSIAFGKGKKEIQGKLTGHTVWRAEDGPFVLTRSAAVDLESTLQIEEGTHILAEDGVYLRVDGELIVEGTEQNPVTFNAVDPAKPWGGIKFTKPAKPWDGKTGSRLRHAKLLHGGAESLDNFPGFLDAMSTTILLEDVEVAWFDSPVRLSGCIVIRCHFHDSQSEVEINPRRSNKQASIRDTNFVRIGRDRGIYLNAAGFARLEDCTIEDCGRASTLLHLVSNRGEVQIERCRFETIHNQPAIVISNASNVQIANSLFDGEGEGLHFNCPPNSKGPTSIAGNNFEVPIGIRLGSTIPTFGGGPFAGNVSAKGNYWSTGSPQSQIVDENRDIALGLVDWEPALPSRNMEAGPRTPSNS